MSECTSTVKNILIVEVTHFQSLRTFSTWEKKINLNGQMPLTLANPIPWLALVQSLVKTSQLLQTFGFQIQGVGHEHLVSK